MTVFSFLLVSNVSAEETKSIMLLTWRGMTPAEQGFMTRLFELGVKAQYDHFDAGRDVTKLAGYLRENRKTIAQKDLIYTFGTTTTVTVQNFDIGNVPQVFNIVTDPVGNGITLSIEKPSNGATGAKLSLSADAILHLLETIYPFKTIAVLFDPREVNATHEADKVAMVAGAMEKPVTRLRLVPDSVDLDRQIEALKPQIEMVDVVYVASTSSFMTTEGMLRRIIPSGKVSVGSSSAMIDRGITLAFGDDYWKRGEAAADVAAEILLEGKLPSQVPINEITPEEAIVFVNSAAPAREKLNFKNLPNKIKYK